MLGLGFDSSSYLRPDVLDLCRSEAVVDGTDGIDDLLLRGVRLLTSLEYNEL